VTDDDASQEENLQEDARESNSNLQRLIDVIGGLLSASGDVLVRLQHILGSAATGSNGADEPDPPPDCRDR
jgi:hypothetical protein